MPRMLIFGLGYSAARLAARLRAEGWQVDATGSAGNLDFADAEAVNYAIGSASHILSSVPPADSGGSAVDGGDSSDPVLDGYGRALASAPARWIGYLSSTGVYGDCGGAWVDESAPVGQGRRAQRSRADLAWQGLRDDVRVFRLPGIYGPGRSAFDRLREGKARRIAAPGQVFSRVHVEDIAAAVIASFAGPPGVYNIADDAPAPGEAVIAHAAKLIGLEPPPLEPLAEATLSPMARDFYSENRRVANGRAKRLLHWRPAYPTYRDGLAAILLQEGH